MPFQRVLTCFALMTLTLPAVAGINSFTPTGPEGAATYDVAYVGGGALLATTTRAIYRSTDGGASWVRSRDGASWTSGHLAVNPANRDIVLFGSIGELLRSTDGGVTWAAVPNLAQLQLNPVAFIRFSADGSIAWMAQQGGDTLYRSTDAGVTWTSLSTGVGNPIFSLAVDSADAQRIYVFAAGGHFLSVNAGSTFTPLALSTYVGAFATSRTTANTVLVPNNDDNRFYLSTNGGSTWAVTAWNPTPRRMVGMVQYVPGTPGKAIAMDREFRLLRTLDDGQNWTELGSAPNGQIYTISFHPADPTHIWLATYGGLFESTDDGATWVERNRGLREGNVRKVVTSQAGTGATYLQSWDLESLYVRAAGTSAWNPIGRTSTSLLGPPASLTASFGYTTLGVSRQNPQLLYMSRNEKFAVSNDGGLTWSLRAPVPDMDSMEVSPANDQVIFMGNGAQAPIRSTNGGVSWTNLAANGLPAEVRHFAFDPVNTNVVYAAISNYLPPAATAVYKSVDGGANFVPAGWNAPQNASIVWKLSHDPARTNIAYLSAYHGLYKTIDGGASWAFQPLFNDNRISGGAVDLIIDPQSPNVLYASAYQRPWIARSVNGGTSWDIIPESDAIEQFGTIALVPGTRTKLVAVRWAGTREIDFVARLGVTTSPAAVTVNTAASSVLTVTNRAGFAASGVQLTATLPASSSAHTVQPSSGTCSVAGATLTCDLGILAANAQTTVTLGYTPTSVGNSNVTVTSYEPDDNIADNTAQLEVGSPIPPPVPSGGGGGGGGGGGRLDYLLILFLFLSLTRTPPLRRHIPSWASALKKH